MIKSDSTNKKVMNRLQEHLEAALVAHPCDWFAIIVQGSWNYGMADEESDVDSKMLTIPSMEDLVFNRKPMNLVHIMENDEHVDMKDMREYFKIFRKSNINFVEILFSDYWIVNDVYYNEWMTLKENAELLARLNPYAAISCMKGMASEKVHALCHEYPSRMPWIEKFGYDPKQLSHLARINYFIRTYVENNPYKDCIYPKNEELRYYLLNMKRNGNGRSKEEAIEYANTLMNGISYTADLYRGKENPFNEKVEVYENKNNPVAETILDNVLYKVVTKSLYNDMQE